MDALIGIVAGFFLGSIFSVVIMSLCVTSKRSETNFIADLTNNTMISKIKTSQRSNKL